MRGRRRIVSLSPFERETIVFVLAGLALVVWLYNGFDEVPLILSRFLSGS
jgi:hypothetical protein